MAELSKNDGAAEEAVSAEAVEAAISAPVAKGEPILQVRNLVKHFPLTQGVLFKKQVGAVKAVDGVSFDLYQGETLGIVGESGCGKSTVAKLLMNLERATAGEVFYKGQDITKLSGRALKAVRRNIQMVFQDPYTSLNPRMTVGDIIGETFEIHPEVAPKGDRRRKVQELLDVVGLNPEYINRYPHQFSGGQRQRIGIARGLALNPEIIICDEPCRSTTTRRTPTPRRCSPPSRSRTRTRASTASGSSSPVTSPRRPTRRRAAASAPAAGRPRTSAPRRCPCWRSPSASRARTPRPRTSRPATSRRTRTSSASSDPPGTSSGRPSRFRAARAPCGVSGATARRIRSARGTQRSQCGRSARGQACATIWVTTQIAQARGTSAT